MENPTWLSLLPPLLAILLAIITRKVVPSLGLGVLSAAFIANGWQPLKSIAHAFTAYLWPSIIDPYHFSVIIFAMLLGAMIMVVAYSGGAAALANVFTKLAHSARSSQFATACMGLAIFFDDYASALIVGSTMRPITDSFKVSREKLAYLVDSTTAPIAALFVSTWIGYEIGIIGDALAGTGFTMDAFSIFVVSIPARFYAIFAIIFVFMIVISKRDFGPMLAAEKRARTTKQLVAADTSNAAIENKLNEMRPASHWKNAALPILVTIFVTILVLYLSGRNAVTAAGGELLFRNILSNANTSKALVMAAFAGLLTALWLPLRHKHFSPQEAISAVLKGFKTMLPGLVIIILAWSLGAATKDLKTAAFVVSLLSDAISSAWLPMLIFVFGSFISLATGSSWGTMAILMPIVVPLAWTLSQKSGMSLDQAHDLLALSVSSVLAGSIWGDHCSPISDTTILSSIASSCNHIDHVRTQMPYALAVGFVTIVAGYLPVALGASISFALLLGIVAMGAIVLLFGKKTD